MNARPGGVDFTEGLVEIRRRELHPTSHSKTAHVPPGTSLLLLRVPWVPGPCLSHSSPHPTLLSFVGNVPILGTRFPRSPFSPWLRVRVPKSEVARAQETPGKSSHHTGKVVLGEEQGEADRCRGSPGLVSLLRRTHLSLVLLGNGDVKLTSGH